MQNFTHNKSYQKFLAFFQALAQENYPKSLSKDEIRQIIREEFSLLLREASSDKNSRVVLEKNLSEEKIFIPFARWKRDKDEKEKIYDEFTLYGYFACDEGDNTKPRFVSSDLPSVKLIWLKPLTQLIYFLFYLEHIYDAIFLPKPISEIISENFFIYDKESKKLLPPDLESVRTQCSRILPLIKEGKRQYPAIDNILIGIFNKYVE